MNMQRRDFLRGVLAAGALAATAGALTGAAAAHAAPSSGTSTRLGSTESWLLSTGRRALG